MTSPTSTKRKLCDFSEETVVVEVGLQKKRFTIHPTILSNNSKFFKAALSTRWRGRTGDPILLPEEHANTFQSYVSYVSSGKIEEEPDSTDNSLPELSEQGIKDKFSHLGGLYVLGDHIEDKRLRNAVMNALIEYGARDGKYFTAEMVELAFEKTGHNSALCRYVVDGALGCMTPEWLESAYNYLPAAFLKQLLLGWAKSAADWTVKHKLPLQLPLCTYHEHDEEVPQDDICLASLASTMQANKKRRFQQK